MKLSIVICTHNPRLDYLGSTLDSISDQDLGGADWELMIVYNASKIPVAQSVDLSWKPGARVVVEEELGLTPARLRGLAEARGEIIVFADDDNVLAANYLSQVLELFRDYPRIGCLGAGILEPEFETTPAEETRPYLSYLALRTIERDHWGNQISGMIPWGAGLAIRREVADLYIESIQGNQLAKTLDRKGDSLVSGGDDEFSHVAVRHGWGVGIFRSLSIVHLIGSRRLEISYLERLIRASGLTRAMLAHLHGRDTIPPVWPFSFKQLLTLWKKVSTRDFLKFGYGVCMKSRLSDFDQRMGELQFEGWLEGARRFNLIP